MKPTPWIVMGALTLWGTVRGVEEALRLWVERRCRH